MVRGPSARTGARPRGATRLGVALGITAVAALMAVSCSGDDFKKTADGFNIEPASEVGPHAFTPSVVKESAMGLAGEGGELAASGPACDTEQFLTELKERPDAYREWGKVLGIPPGQVDAYIRALGTDVLTSDTKVTNHGLKDGHAYPRQSVLTAGTAVLVDAGASGAEPSTTTSSSPPARAPGGGIIVTRCKCGNPLLPPGDPTAPTTTLPPDDYGTGTSTPGSVPGSTAPATSSSRSTTSRASSTSTSPSTTSTISESTSTTGSEQGSADAGG